MMTTDYLELADYRRTVAAIYANVRNEALAPDVRWHQFRRDRDRLFGTHSQSALSDEQKTTFQGLRYFEYNPALALHLPLESDVEPAEWETELPEDGRVAYRRIGRIRFELGGQPVSLSVFWQLGYGGGLFLPFRDATNRDRTYGGGRYLLDTIKAADLGRTRDGLLVVDFNYAYNPSCAYNPRWHCPLPPPENWLPVAIEAGELLPV